MSSIHRLSLPPTYPSSAGISGRVGEVRRDGHRRYRADRGHRCRRRGLVDELDTKVDGGISLDGRTDSDRDTDDECHPELDAVAVEGRQLRWILCRDP